MLGDLHIMSSPCEMIYNSDTDGHTMLRLSG
jgi:hypothetical protein